MGLYEKFGEFDSFNEINELADYLFNGEEIRNV